MGPSRRVSARAGRRSNRGDGGDVLFFGDRVGRVRDPLGNIWWIQEHVEDVDPAQMAQRAQDPAAYEALRYVETSLEAAMTASPGSG